MCITVIYIFTSYTSFLIDAQEPKNRRRAGSDREHNEGIVNRNVDYGSTHLRCKINCGIVI